MRSITFIEDPFQTTIMAAAACHCTAKDDYGELWNALYFIEVVSDDDDGSN